MNKKKSTKSRYQQFYGRAPPKVKAEVFGTLVYYNDGSKKKKLQNKAQLGIFVGFQDDGGTYRIYDTAERRIVISRDVMFFNNTKLPEEVENNNNEKLIIDEEEIEIVEELTRTEENRVEKRKRSREERRKLE